MLWRQELQRNGLTALQRRGQTFQVHQGFVRRIGVTDQVGLHGRHGNHVIGQTVGKIIGHCRIVVSEEADKQSAKLRSVGVANPFLAVDSTGPDQRGVQSFQVIRGCKEDSPFARRHSVEGRATPG